MNLTAIFEPDDDGGYVCWIEEIPGAFSQGETLTEAKENLLDALKILFDVYREEANQKISHQSGVIKQEIYMAQL